MKKDYVPQIMKLLEKGAKSSSRISIYNPTKGMYYLRYFPKEDVDKMKESGVHWLTHMCNYGLSTRNEPWWHHGYAIKAHLQIKNDHIFSSMDIISREDKEKIWEAFLWFIRKIYVIPRYRWMQDTLWKDLRRDYAFSRQFFVGQGKLYVEFLLHHIAALVGYEIGNVEGD